MDALWFKNAVIYSLDVATFQDTDGDGIGDLPGVTERLDYLRGLGVTCLWLLPFFPTPDRDNGYDVSDYYGVDPRHGRRPLVPGRAAEVRGVHQPRGGPDRRDRHHPAAVRRLLRRWAQVHMQFNFYLNNFLWLSLARRDTAAIGRALQALPPAPHAGQYAVWLRNHDELDLQRLTEEERAEVLEQFAPDPDMQMFRRGPRRRAAPMITDPSRLRMAHALVFSLPGAPVLWYGEEIGMGDDLSLQERAAVRTPMQWSSRLPNAGFSDARVEDLVRQVPEIGTGRWHIVDSGCSTVLGVRYDAGRSSVITMVNLDDEDVEVQAQAFEELEHVRDVLADQPYPRPEADAPLRLGPHGYRWIRGRSRYQS